MGIMDNRRSLSEICDLNDDCIFEILDRLSHDSLLRIAFTCKRLYELAAAHYRRQNPTKSVCFQITTDSVEIQPNEVDIQIFGFRLWNIIVRGVGQNWHMAEHALRYIAINCGRNARNVRFERMMLSRIHLNVLKHLLHRMETLTLHKVTFIDDFYADFLQHCMALKHLIISDSIGMMEKDPCGWLTKDYPNLESICISSTMATSFQFNDLWDNFFRRHPQIKSFSCHYIYVVDPAARPIKAIERNATNLERLYLSLHRIGHLNSTYYDLSMLCARPTFKFLELHMAESSVHNLILHNKMLVTFNALKAIHLSQLTLNPDICGALAAFTNLEQINNTKCTVGTVCSELLAKGLPNLKRIYGEWTFDDLAAFIRYSSKLTEIHLSNEMTVLVMCDGTSLYDLHEERTRLPNASVLTIYLQLPTEAELNPFEIDSNQLIRIEKQPNDELFDVKYTFSSNCV